MTLRILIAGRERFAAPFYPDAVAETARLLREQLPSLRRLGRVAVIVTDDSNIAHIIIAR